MIGRTYGCSVLGVDAHLITIEVNKLGGTGIHMVGLPDNAIRESSFRIESALKCFDYTLPRRKIVINLAPADIRKEGTAYDLPIALGILLASGQISTSTLHDYVILGELSLDGKLRPIKGVLPIAIEARRKKVKGFILPKSNAKEAAIVNNLEVVGVENIQEAIDYLEGKGNILPESCHTRDIFEDELNSYVVDFSHVQGQKTVKRALEVSAAGGHNVIMVGPPGAGKTMLAKRLPTILPPLSLHESLETTKIHSVAGKLDVNSSLIANRPFRSPHHTISDVALVGGGSHPQPGEISLAHNGVLFLDEIPEFKRSALEVMRQPLEERMVTISRARLSVDFPANFMLIASMNPCPCGYYTLPEKKCSTCSDTIAQKYIGKISGPLLDRIDIHLEVLPVPFDEMTSNREAESSEEIRKRVISARSVQEERFADYPHVHTNSMMSSQMVRELCILDKPSKNMLKKAMERLGLSARAYDRILKVSRTIADLEGKEKIGFEHLAEAIQYRSLDRDIWNS